MYEKIEDLSKALEGITPMSQKGYRKAYEALGPEKAKEIAKTMGTVYMVTDHEDYEAEYQTLIEEDGHTYSYGVRFIEIYGEWKIDRY